MMNRLLNLLSAKVDTNQFPVGAACGHSHAGIYPLAYAKQKAVIVRSEFRGAAEWALSAARFMRGALNCSRINELS